MKPISNNLYWCIIVGIILLTACKDKNSLLPNPPPIPAAHAPQQVISFLNRVKLNPPLINGKLLGDSWRVTHEKYNYHDGTDANGNPLIKSQDADIPSNASYQRYWIFGKDSVMLSYKGQFADKNWDNYFEKFKMKIDEPSLALTVDYIYDNGAKKYSTPWTITSITDTYLVLTYQDASTDYLYQYTLHKENL